MRILVAVDPGGIEGDVLEVTKQLFESASSDETVYDVVHVQFGENEAVDTLLNAINIWSETVDKEVTTSVERPYQVSDQPMREEVGSILLDVAEEKDIDHMVIGVQERGPLYRFLYGSTSNVILGSDDRDYPVTVVTEKSYH